MGEVTVTSVKRKRSTNSDSSCWQIEIQSKCTADKWNHMFENKLYTDMRLLVGKNLEPIVECHKIVLILNSPVFESMLSTRWKTDSTAHATTGTKEELRLPGDDPSLIKLLISCFYVGNPATVDEALDLLLIAKKYICPQVITKCLQFLKTSINEKNVVEIFQTAYLLDEPELLKQAESSILSKACNLVRLQEFSKLTSEHLKYFLGHDHLNVDEMDLFNAVCKWGQLECERQNQDSAKRENLFEVLKDILPLIRFHRMDPNDFLECVLDKKMLPLEQASKLMCNFTNFQIRRSIKSRIKLRQKREAEDAGSSLEESNDLEPPPKLDSQKTKARSRNIFYYIFKRLKEYDLSSESKYNFGEQWNNLCFKVDQDIRLVSVGFFRSVLPFRQIVVKVRIMDEDMNHIFSELEQKTTCFPSPGKDIFHVSFPKPVRISKDVLYTISYKILWQETHFVKIEPLAGELWCSPDLKINFWFKEAKEASNMNQVPELCFEL